jgi:hypothetical protein
VPQYRFAGTGPAAAVGAAALWIGDRVRRRGLGLLLVWALSGGAAVMLLLIGAAVPAHRLLAFAFGIPILVCAGIVSAARLLATRVPAAGPALGAIVVLAALSGVAFLGYRVWSPTVPWLKAEPYVESATAGEYLSLIGGDRPAIFVIDEPAQATGAVNLPFRVIRSALPGDQVKRTYVYLGNADLLLQGKKTVIPGNSRYNLVSRHFFAGLQPILDENPIVIALRTYNRHFAQLATAHPNQMLTEDMLLLRGPPPPTPIQHPPAPRPHSTVWFAAVTAAVLTVLFLVGLGWSMALVPGTAFVRAAMAPSFGVATLAIAGLLAGRLGLPLSGGGGLGVALATLLAGAAVAGARSRSWYGGAQTTKIKAEAAAPSGSPSPRG